MRHETQSHNKLDKNWISETNYIVLNMLYEYLIRIESYPKARCDVLPCGQAIPPRDIGYFSESKPPRLNPIDVSSETFFVQRKSMCIGTSLMANMGWFNVIENRHYNLATVPLTVGDFNELLQAPA